MGRTHEEHSPVSEQLFTLSKEDCAALCGVLHGGVTQSKPLTCHIRLYPRKFQQRRTFS